MNETGFFKQSRQGHILIKRNVAMTNQHLSLANRIDHSILRIRDWVMEDEKRATIAILSATTAIFFVWGLCLMLNMPLPDHQ